MYEYLSPIMNFKFSVISRQYYLPFSLLFTEDLNYRLNNLLFLDIAPRDPQHIGGFRSDTD